MVANILYLIHSNLSIDFNIQFLNVGKSHEIHTIE